MKLKPIVQVTWLDATKHFDEDLTKSTPIGALRTTVGYLVRDCRAGVIVACDHTEGTDKGASDYSNGFTIPRAYIERMVVLRAT